MSYLRTFQAAAFIGAMGFFSGALGQASPTSFCESLALSAAAGFDVSSSLASHPECLPRIAPTSDSTVSTQAVESTSVYQALAISNQISVVLTTLFTAGPPSRAGFRAERTGTGLAAGAPQARNNAWVTYSKNWVDFTRAGSSYDSDVNNVIVGYDYRWNPNLLVGVSAAFDDGDANLTFANARTESRGFTIAPYLGYQINQNWSADVSVGLGRGKIDSRTATLSGSTNSDRQFVAGNLNYVHWAGNIQWLGKASLLDASEDKDGFTLGTVAVPSRKDSITQFRLGGQVGYWYNNLLPFASLTYSNDVRRTRDPASVVPELEKDSWLLGLGLNFFSRGQLWAALTYTTEFGRSDYRNNVLLANINFRF